MTTAAIAVIVLMVVSLVAGWLMGFLMRVFWWDVQDLLEWYHGHDKRKDRQP